MKKIKIATDFSDTPVGRYPSDSKFNGERFREEFLVPALKDGGRVVVDIDGTEGYGSSFLDEAFGGLVRKGHFEPAELERNLIIEHKEPSFGTYKSLIWKYIREAGRLAPA